MGHFFKSVPIDGQCEILLMGNCFCHDGRSSLTNEKGHHYFLNRLQVEQVNFME